MRYVTSFLSYHTNQMCMNIVQASSEEEAMLNCLRGNDIDTNGDGLVTKEDIKQFAFDCDCMVDAIRIS